MTQTRHPVSFIATTDPEGAKFFYGDILGLQLVENSPFALVYSDEGQMLRVQIVSELVPAVHTVHGWKVDDISAEVALLGAKGVEFLRFEGMAQSEEGIWSTPGGHKIAWFKDPDGNVLSLTEFI